jgi:hypothetical protein
MYDIEGALRRRALAERLEALNRGDAPADDGGMPADGGPAPGQASEPGPQGPAVPDAQWPGAIGPRHRTGLPEEPRRPGQGSPPPVPAPTPGGALQPSPYMTPISEPPVPPPGYVPAAARRGLADLPATSLPGATAPSTDGIPGATVSVTLSSGTPLPVRSPGRSGAGRPVSRPAAPTAPAAPPMPAAPPRSPVAPPAPFAPAAFPPTPAEPAEQPETGPRGQPATGPTEQPAAFDAVHDPEELESAADVAARPPVVGTAASAIADLLRTGDSSLFFDKDTRRP